MQINQLCGLVKDSDNFIAWKILDDKGEEVARSNAETEKNFEEIATIVQGQPEGTYTFLFGKTLKSLNYQHKVDNFERGLNPKKMYEAAQDLLDEKNALDKKLALQAKDFEIEKLQHIANKYKNAYLRYKDKCEILESELDSKKNSIGNVIQDFAQNRDLQNLALTLINVVSGSKGIQAPAQPKPEDVITDEPTKQRFIVFVAQLAQQPNEFINKFIDQATGVKQ